MLKQNTSYLLCRLAEDDIYQNLDMGEEYTGFKDLLRIIPKNHISENGIVYDITNNSECDHIINFIKDVEKESPPKLEMTCGSFFSKNKKIKKIVTKNINSLASAGIPVSVFGGGIDVRDLLADSVVFTAYNRQITHVPHFMITNERFLLELPHTEKNKVRIDIISDTFEQQIRKEILDYLGTLITGLKNKE